MSTKAGVSARVIAWKALRDWKDGKGFISERVKVNGSHSPDGDRALAIELANGVCRNQSMLEFNIKRFVKHMPKSSAKLVLLIGVYQLYQDEKFESYAAVDLTVELAKEVLHAREVGMINGVLRSITRDKVIIKRHSRKLGDVAISYSHPGWMIHRWNEELGFNKMIRRLRHNNQEPLHWVRVNLSKVTLSEVMREFEPILREELAENEEVEWRFDRYLQWRGSLRKVLRHEWFAQGKVSLQDPSSWLMTRLLGLEGKETVLDLCAAPGGKTALLMEEFPELKVVASELKPRRLKLFDDLKNRLDLDPQKMVMDGRAPAFKPESFTHILLDAPCSNLGVIQRRPEARWLEGVKEILKQAELQKELLESAAKLLKVGGVLVYGTCSPEPEETINLVDEFIENHPEFEVQSARKFFHRNYCYDRYLRIIPQPNSLDGFFGVRLVKIS